MTEYDTSLIRPLIRTAVQNHPDRQRVEQLLGAGVQIQLREMEPHPDNPPASVDDAEFQAFIHDRDDIIVIAMFPGRMLIPPVAGIEIGPPHIDVGVVQHPYPQVRLALSWPQAADMPNVDVTLNRNQTEHLRRSLEQALDILDDLDSDGR